MSNGTDRLTPVEAGRILGCGPDYARRLFDSGKLTGERGSLGIRLIDRTSVERFKKERDRERAGARKD